MNRQILPRIAATFIAFALAATALPQDAKQPPVITLVKGALTLESIDYVKKTANLVFSVPQPGVPRVIVQGVTFRDLVIDDAGVLVGVKTQFGSDTDSQLAGIKLHIPADTTLTYVKPDQVLVTNGSPNSHIDLTLPVPTQNGPIKLQVSRFSLDETGSTGTLSCQVQMAADLQYPGFLLSQSPLKVDIAWPGSAPATWSVKSVRRVQNDANSDGIDLKLGVSGLPTKGDGYPLTATVHQFKLDQQGKVSFTGGTLQVSGAIEPDECPGFTFTVASGNVTMTDNVPKFDNVVADVNLPAFPKGSPVKLSRVSLLIGDGVLAQATNIDIKVQDLTIHADQCTLDLSTSATYADIAKFTAHQPAGSPPSGAGDQNKPNWQGLYIPVGKATITVGVGQELKLSGNDVLVDSAGPSGNFGLDSSVSGQSQANIDGVILKSSQVNLNLKRGQVTKGEVSGNFDIEGAGSISAKVKFSLDGKYAFAVKGDPKVDIPELGIRIDKVDCSIDNSKIILGGKLTFTSDELKELKNLSITVKNLPITKAGKLQLPDLLELDVPDGARFDVGPVFVEVRQIGFTATNGKLDGVLFSGGGGLTGDFPDILPLKNELDLDKMKVRKDPATDKPKFDLGKIKLEAEFLKIGSVSGEFDNFKNDPKWGDGLAGKASLTLNCLGAAPIGSGFQFLLAPQANVGGGKKDLAFFVGGSVTIPPVLVQLPVPPPGAPIPLFNINYGRGGFGWNVQLNDIAHPKIAEPRTDLKPGTGPLLQIGLGTSDPVPPGSPGSGHLWWADTSLTVTLKPLNFNLAAQAVFGDLDPNPIDADLTLDDWHDKDRIASAFINLNLSDPSLTMGGSFDLTFPTRKLSVLSMEGSGQLVIDKEGAELTVGTKKHPLTIKVLPAVEEIAEIKASGYARLKIDAADKSLSGNLHVDADAKLELPFASVDVELTGDLDASIGVNRPFRAKGTFELDGVADFGFFVAQAHAECDAFFNTADKGGRLHKDELYLTGDMSATVNGVSVATKSIDLHIKAS